MTKIEHLPLPCFIAGVVPAWGGLCDQRGALPKCVGLQAMREGMSYSEAAWTELPFLNGEPKALKGE